MSAKLQLYDTFFPAFGSGAPGVTVPKDRPYYDTDTTPFTPYIYNRGAGGWFVYSPPASPIDADAIQGISVSVTPPTAGNLLVYNGTEYAPT